MSLSSLFPVLRTLLRKSASERAKRRSSELQGRSSREDARSSGYVVHGIPFPVISSYAYITIAKYSYLTIC